MSNSHAQQNPRPRGKSLYQILQSETMTALRREAAQWKIPEAKTGTRRILIALLLLAWEKYRTKFESRNPIHVRPNT